MGQGRTIWWAKDSTWNERETNVVLGTEFGAEGPHLMDVLCCQAKLENAGGHVKTGYLSLGRRAFIADESRVRAIVARAVEIGALDDFTEAGLTFEARISGWAADQELASSAERQRRYRQRLKEEDIPVGTDKGTSATDYRTLPHKRDVTSLVTNVTPTGQDRTELPTADAVGSARRRTPTRRIDQSIPPDGFPEALSKKLPQVLEVLIDTWQLRGGVQPQPRGVALGMMRNPGADHLAVARKLQHWLTAGNGQNAKCKDVAARFGDWVADEVPATAPKAARARSVRESPSDMLRAIKGEAA